MPRFTGSIRTLKLFFNTNCFVVKHNMLYDYSGKTDWHYALRNKTPLTKEQIAEIPEEVLFLENNSLFIQFVAHERLSELPDKYITHESLTTQYCLSHGKKSAERINAAYILIDRGSFKDIPKHLITEKLLLSPDREILTDFSGIEPSLSDGKFFYCSLISTAAMSGAIKEIPQELLTYDLMNYYDNSDTISNTPAIWYAAKNGNLKHCPKNSYNETSLLKLVAGKTMWHFAAENGEIREIPKEYYTEEAFLIKDKKGKFVADYLSEEDKVYVNNVLNERLQDVLVMSRTVVTTKVGEFVL